MGCLHVCFFSIVYHVFMCIVYVAFSVFSCLACGLSSLSLAVYGTQLWVYNNLLESTHLPKTFPEVPYVS